MLLPYIQRLFVFAKDESGQGLGEYGMLLMLTVILVIAALEILANAIIDNFWNIPSLLGG